MQEMQEMWVWSLSCEDPLEEEMATHTPEFLPGESMDRGAWRATVYGVTESDATDHTHTHTHTQTEDNIQCD